jgi:aminocarboxymuconate-semialdehyde decarboxylase
MIVDVHAHYVSPRVAAAVRGHEDRYGVRIVDQPDGEPRFVVGARETARPQALLPALQDLDARQQTMIGQTVDHQVVSLALTFTGYDLPAEQGAAWARLLNDTTAEDLQVAPGRFTATATVPLQDGPAAATELQRAIGTLGYHGIVISTHVAGRNLDDRGLDPFWAAAQEASAPIIIHPALVLQSPRLASYYFTNLLGNPYDTAIAAASLVFGGVCDRYPDLKIMLVHGGGHFPYQIGRLTHGWSVRPETKALQTPPLDYLKWFYYDTVLYYGPALRYLAAVVGPDRLMLGTDYPYDMCPAHPRQVVADAGFAAAERDGIESGTSTAVFRLEPPA